ncbi:MAG TPA: hypothetical protein VGC09_07480 [Rhodopila sp.]
MNSRLTMAGLSVLALSMIAALSAAVAQPPKGRLYAFHSTPTGACPAMDWHIVLQPDNTLVGFIAWDEMKHLAKVSGTLETGRIFHLAAVEQGGAERTGTVKGQVEDTFIVASLDGTRTGCDNQQISVPYFASGLSGGGG